MIASRPLIQTVDACVPLNSAVWKTASRRPKRPVVFCNGIGANLELARAFAEQVTDRDVLTFDVPGIGGSLPTSFPYRLWTLANWVKALIQQYGYEQIDLVGLSWGGTLAQQMAFQFPNLVHKVVLAATTPGVVMLPGKVNVLSKMLHFKRYSDAEYLRQNFEELYGEELGEALEVYSGLIKAPSVKGYVYQLLALSGWSSLPMLPFLRQDVLVLMGERDKVVPSVNGRIISAMAPNAKYALVEKAGHLFIITRAKEVAPVVMDFFDGRKSDARIRLAA